MRRNSFLKYSSILILCVFLSCTENEPTIPIADNRIHFLIKPYEYSTNHFFIDSVYSSEHLKIYEDYYNNNPSIKNEFYYVKQIVVCQTFLGLPSAEEIRANIFCDLPTRGPNDEYPTSFRETEYYPEPICNQRLIELVEGEDYIINRYTGIVSILNLPTYYEDRLLAVSFRIEGPSLSDEDDIIYGEFDFSKSMGMDYEYAAIFKLIKMRKNYNRSVDCWNMVRELQLKNIYSLGYNNISQNDFLFQIYFVTDDLKSLSSYEGISLLKAFGFDKDNDGLFDFRESISVLPETGEIIFPTLRPFSENIPSIFASDYEINSIYEGEKEDALMDSSSARFYFAGKYNVE
ncbi:hypothetical protein ACFLTH_03685 [Bacteroidota bacterium]